MDIKLVLMFLILASALGSAVWNLHVKKSNNSLVFVTLMVIPQFLIALPICFFIPVPSSLSWSFILLSALVQTGYIIFLSTAYRHGMLSRIYPLAIGSAPLISLVFWYLVLGGELSKDNYYGVLLLSVGVICFAFARKKTADMLSIRGVLYAFGTSLFIFLYSMIDSFGIRTVDNPLTYISWLFVIKAILLFIPMLLLNKIHMRAMLRKSSNYIMAGLLAGCGYAIAIWAFTHEATSVVLALRSTSIIFAFILSIIFLKEKANFFSFVLTFTIAIGVFLILI